MKNISCFIQKAFFVFKIFNFLYFPLPLFFQEFIHIVRTHEGKGAALKRMFTYEGGCRVCEIKDVRRKIYLHFLKSDKHLRKIYIYTTQEMNQVSVSHLALFLFFVPLFHVCFAVEQNIVLKKFFLQILRIFPTTTYLTSRSLKV